MRSRPSSPMFGTPHEEHLLCDAACAQEEFCNEKKRRPVRIFTDVPHDSRDFKIVSRSPAESFSICHNLTDAAGRTSSVPRTPQTHRSTQRPAEGLLNRCGTGSEQVFQAR